MVILDHFVLAVDVDGLELVVSDVDEPNWQELLVGDEKQDLVLWLNDVHDGSLLEELLHLIPGLSNEDVRFPCHFVIVDRDLNASFFQLDCVEHLEYKYRVFLCWLIEEQSQLLAFQVLASCIGSKLDLFFLEIIQEDVIGYLMVLESHLLWLFSDNAIIINLLVPKV